MKTLLISILLASQMSVPVLAAEGDFEGRVTFKTDEGSIITPFNTYGGEIKYYLPRDSKITYDYNGTSHVLDMEEIVTEAIGEWLAVFAQIKPGAPTLAFTRVDDPEMANLEISVEDRPRFKDPHTLASGSPKVKVLKGTPAILIFYRDAIQELLRPENRDNFNKLMKYIAGEGDQKAVNTVEFMAKVTAKHELGHVLGFGHPDSVLAVEDPHNVTLLRIQLRHRIVINRFPDPEARPRRRPGIPIMTRDMESYMRFLSIYLNHLLTADDVTIAPQEQRAILYLSERAEQGCSSSSSSSAARYSHNAVKSDYYCPKLPYTSPLGALPTFYMVGALNNVWAFYKKSTEDDNVSIDNDLEPFNPED